MREEKTELFTHTGVTLGDEQLQQYREQFDYFAGDYLEFLRGIRAEVVELKHGMIVFELSYPADINFSHKDRLLAFQGLFNCPVTPSLDDLDHLLLVEYLTINTQTYSRFSKHLAEGEFLEPPSTERLLFRDQIYDAEDLWYLLFDES